jgi:hypothetical protein
MSFLNSLFLGTEGAYNAFGIDVIFIKNKQAISRS